MGRTLQNVNQAPERNGGATNLNAIKRPTPVANNSHSVAVTVYAENTEISARLSLSLRSEWRAVTSVCIASFLLRNPRVSRSGPFRSGDASIEREPRRLPVRLRKARAHMCSAALSYTARGNRQRQGDHIVNMSSLRQHVRWPWVVPDEIGMACSPRTF